MEKKLESYEDVFADIINAFVFQGKGVITPDSLTDAATVSMYKADGKLHEQERDVAKYWNAETGEQIRVRIAYFGIENQTAYDRDMPLRVIGYDGATYRAETLKDGKDRYPVITLVLYFGEKRWQENRCLYDVLRFPEALVPFVSDYRINICEIAYLTEEEVQRFHSDFRIVADYFSKRRTDPDYRPTDTTAFKHVDEVLKLFTAVTGDSRFADELMDKRGKPKNMCEVLDRAEERGRKIGEEIGERRGEKRGEKRGERRGIRKGKIQLLRKWVRSDRISIESAAEEIGMTVDAFRKEAKL